MRSRRLGLGLVALAMLGCAGRSRGGETASPGAPSGSPPSVVPLSLAMLGTNGATLTDGDAIDRLFAAPEISAAGERLLGRLGQEPSLQSRYDGFTGRLFEQPAMLEALTALALASPGISSDELATAAGARLSAGADSPAFDAALDAALDRLLERPTVDAAFGRMAGVLVERARFTERLAALLVEWRPELEAAVGVSMTDERFGARLEQHLADPVRATALQQLFSERMFDDPGVRQGVIALIDDEAFVAACVAVVRALLDGSGFQEHAAAVFAGMIEGVSAEEMRIRVDRALITPEIEAAVVTWTEAATTCPAFTGLAERLGAVLDDPGLRAELLAIVAGTAASRTARGRLTVQPSAA